MRAIKLISRADKVNMGNVIVDQALPTSSIKQQDPFLLIHHWYQNFPGDQKARDLGVGPHPHRGFSPVTIIYEGSLHHRDSLGNSSIVNKGGVQWMNAGKGITHSERPASNLAESGGEFEIIQFWINSPSQHKMDPAKYTALHAENIPVVDLDDKGSTMQIISGEYKTLKGPAPNLTPMLIGSLSLAKETKVSIDLDNTYSTILYQLNGRSEINGKKIGAKTAVLFENEAGKVNIETLDDTRILLLSGAAINEPVNSYGPFVMNTTTEIMEAIRDAQMGKMGVLIEEFS